MHHFHYKNGVLHAEDLSMVRLAAEVGTPFYCYSTATLERHYRVLAEAFDSFDALICYAVKANSNQAVLRTMARLGAGMDVVSEGELRRALAVGVPASKIIFAGVGKSREEMAFALNQGVLGFNVESEQELQALSDVAAGAGQTARVALRINPDVDAETHAKIATGKAENKFGIPFAHAPRLYAQARALHGIAANGIHMHIGSQITDLEPFRNAFRLMRELVQALIGDGHALEHLDIGGGLGVPYVSQGPVAPAPSDYAAVVNETLGDLGLKIVLEPGRMIAANAGVLVSEVLFSKAGANKRFTVVDAAMNDLLRPTLYEAWHEIWPVSESKGAQPVAKQDVVGPICETGDYLAINRELPPFEPGDLIAVMTAGAYGAVMSSTYNTRRLVPEVLVNGDRYCVVRPRQTYDDLIGMDLVPDWLADK
jgi:diaminopimelate decarboxylase